MATVKQKILRFFYPIIRSLGRMSKNGTVLHNPADILANSSFYNLKITTNKGEIIDCATFKGKKVVLVNTASDCGYTAQYEELQTLSTELGAKLTIIAFPSNDFAEQEKLDDQTISNFCHLNYGVTFPIAKKSAVRKGDVQQPVFQWLCDHHANGWNDHEPDWNFSKYVIDERGALMHYFGPSISPLESQFRNAII